MYIIDLFEALKQGKAGGAAPAGAAVHPAAAQLTTPAV